MEVKSAKEMCSDSVKTSRSICCKKISQLKEWENNGK